MSAGQRPARVQSPGHPQIGRSAIRSRGCGRRTVTVTAARRRCRSPTSAAPGHASGLRRSEAVDGAREPRRARAARPGGRRRVPAAATRRARRGPDATWSRAPQTLGPAGGHDGQRDGTDLAVAVTAPTASRAERNRRAVVDQLIGAAAGRGLGRRRRRRSSSDFLPALAGWRSSSRRLRAACRRPDPSGTAA